MKLPEWLEEPIEAFLAVGLLGFCLVPVILLAVAVMRPGWFMLERPNLGCAITLEDNKFIAPDTNWVRFSLSTIGDEDLLPYVFKEVTYTQEVSLRNKRIGWSPAKLPGSWVIEHDTPPGQWMGIREGLPSTLSASNTNQRAMVIEPRGFPAIKVSWVCAIPLLTLAFLFEAIGITLALLDFTGQVSRFEKFLDRRRVRLHAWLFPWRRVRTLVGAGKPVDEESKSDDDLGLFPMLLFLLIMVVTSLSVEITSLWIVIAIFIGSMLLALVLDFVLKWLFGSLVWLLLALLNKAPTGTVGGIGFALVVYGIGGNYIWG
jgi:hypothetical protein